MVVSGKRKLGAGWWALIAFCAAVLVMLIGWAIASGTAGYGDGVGWMMPGVWGWMGAVMPLMLLGMALFWAAIILGLVALVRWIVSLSGGRPAESVDALELARRRYARGEISREEYERIREVLGRAA